MIVDYWFYPLFPIAQGTLPWQPILGLKWAKPADSPSFIALPFLNGVEYRNSDFNSFICDDLATLCKDLVNFSLVTPEFKRMKGVRPLVDQQFRYVASLLDLAGISTKFSGAITTQFCFSYSLGGVTAMPRGLHAGFCHAFLVCPRYRCKNTVTDGRSLTVRLTSADVLTGVILGDGGVGGRTPHFISTPSQKFCSVPSLFRPKLRHWMCSHPWNTINAWTDEWSRLPPTNAVSMATNELSSTCLVGRFASATSTPLSAVAGGDALTSVETLARDLWVRSEFIVSALQRTHTHTHTLWCLFRL